MPMMAPLETCRHWAPRAQKTGPGFEKLTGLMLFYFSLAVFPPPLPPSSPGTCTSGREGYADAVPVDFINIASFFYCPDRRLARSLQGRLSACVRLGGKCR